MNVHTVKARVLLKFALLWIFVCTYSEGKVFRMSACLSASSMAEVFSYRLYSCRLMAVPTVTVLLKIVLLWVCHFCYSGNKSIGEVCITMSFWLFMQWHQRYIWSLYHCGYVIFFSSDGKGVVEDCFAVGLRQLLRWRQKYYWIYFINVAEGVYHAQHFCEVLLAFPSSWVS